MSSEITVVVPAYNAEATIADCLGALAAFMSQGKVIVVDDGSTDRTSDIAAACGARVLNLPGPPRGPAHARNEGAKLARSARLLFVDADVVLGAEAAERLGAAMALHHAVAVIGSYDDSPQSVRSTSRYANLRHHYVHQRSEGFVATFWSGIGLIDRDAFTLAGGFDGDRFAHPSIEDVDLGLRLTRRGARIWLEPKAQGKHLKDWTARQVWHTDIVRRAIPWSRMIARGEARSTGLNMAAGEKAAALLAWLIPVTIVLALFDPRWLYATGVAAGSYVWINRGLFALLFRRGGSVGLAVGMAMHWCYHLYASATFAAVMLFEKLGVGARPPQH